MFTFAELISKITVRGPGRGQAVNIAYSRPEENAYFMMRIVQ